MALDDYFEAEVGIAVAATAALFSPRVRKVLRRGAVYGVAGALIAGDAVVSFAKGVGRGAQQAAASASNGTNGATPLATETAGAKAAPSSKSATRKAEETPTSDAKAASKSAGGSTK